MLGDVAQRMSRRGFMAASGAVAGAAAMSARRVSADGGEAASASTDRQPEAKMKIAEVFSPPADSLWRMVKQRSDYTWEGRL